MFLLKFNILTIYVARYKFYISFLEKGIGRSSDGGIFVGHPFCCFAVQTKNTLLPIHVDVSSECIEFTIILRVVYPISIVCFAGDKDPGVTLTSL